MKLSLYISILTTLLLCSCRKDKTIAPYEPNLPVDSTNVIIDSNQLVYPVLPSSYYDYEGILYPPHFQSDQLLNLINTLNGSNQVTNEGATLGRVLFYDKQLSQNNTVSCASCHLQNKGFADGMTFSAGFNGGLTGRNSMAIVNTNYQRRFFWDERALSLEQQVLMPIQDPIEMGMDLGDLEIKLGALPYYAPLFTAAFGDSTITADRISKALSQFLQSIRSFGSKYDVGLANNFTEFTALETQGMDMFFSGDFNCNHCHTTQNFGGVTNEINGLDVTYADPGIGGISATPANQGNFKSVSLRNIELTAPYMHDGRFATLEEVIDFYSTDIQAHPYLDDRLAIDGNTGGPPKQFNFTAQEKAALVAFFKTLTDHDLISNPIYSNPFPE